MANALTECAEFEKLLEGNSQPVLLQGKAFLLFMC
jgi:hypothetical protein